MYYLALIVKNTRPPGHFRLLVAPCFPPSSPAPSPDLPFRDLQLIDLPFTSLSPSNKVLTELDCPIADDVQRALLSIGLTGFNVADAVCLLKTQLLSIWELMQPWKFWKLMEEPEYGPGPPIRTVFFIVELDADLSPGVSWWMDSQDAWGLLTGKNARKMRLGPLATYAFSPHFPEGLMHKFNLQIKGQEYPPGVLVFPLDSWTQKPFSKTNLVIFASTDTSEQNTCAVARGEALIMDPGCHAIEAQEHLSRLVKSLPKKLLIFLTHHHRDHTEGLPTVQRENPQALIVAHEATIRRVGKVAGTLNFLPVVNGSMLLVGDQELQVIAAPGHTDGHMALLDIRTQTLIVGDHCVGEGSSLLDADSGGNMQEYLSTTHSFLDLAPRVIVPMHGHFNLWPVHMLCNYIRHRQARETQILESIEKGAQTAFDIVSQAYANTPPTMWMAALSNVKLHVDHLKQLQKLPRGFSMAYFKRSCGCAFFLGCLQRAAVHSFPRTWKSNLGHNLIRTLSLAVLMGSICYVCIRKRI